MASRGFRLACRASLLCLLVLCVTNGVMFWSLRHSAKRPWEDAELSEIPSGIATVRKLNAPPSLTKTTTTKTTTTAAATTKTITTTTTTTTKAPTHNTDSATTKIRATQALSPRNVAQAGGQQRSSLERNCQPLPEKFQHRQPFFPCSAVWRSPNSSCLYRTRAVLRCNKSSASLAEERVPVGTAPAAVALDDACLLRVVRQRCGPLSGQRVPRVVHYVHFSPSGKRGSPLPVYTFLGLVSVLRFLQPCLLLFHADYLPYGPHWEALLQLTSRILHVNRTAPASVFGRDIQKVEHKSDVARLQAMRLFGGIYMDTDEVVLRPMDDLMQYHVTMAWETSGAFGNGLFLAEPNNTFLNTWYEKYRTFTNAWWAYFSTTLPFQLYKKHPELNIHVVDTFFRPNLWNITELFYKGSYDWSNHYALHLYYRRNQAYFRGNFERTNSSLGEIARHILFGDKTRCV